MDFQEVPYVPLTGIQKKIALEILGKGNLLLKKWSTFFPPKKFRQFRNAVMSGSNNPEYQGVKSIPASRVSAYLMDLPTMMAIRHTPQTILCGRTVERAILEGHSALAKKHAMKWALEDDPVGLTKQDFIQEAYMQVIEAIYQWLPDNADIITFIWYALKNRMSNVTNQQGHLLCPLTNSDLVLVNKYERTKKKMDHATFDQIVGVLGLSTQEGMYLNGLLTRVYSEQNLSNPDQNDDDESMESVDYTGLRVGLSKESTEVIKILEEDHVTQVLNRAGLTPMERELIECAMHSPHNGWQTEFAANSINPKTNKPYTRMRITQILQKAREKVARVLKAA